MRKTSFTSSVKLILLSKHHFISSLVTALPTYLIQLWINKHENLLLLWILTYTHTQYTHMYVQKSKHVTYLSLEFLNPKEPSSSTRLVLELNKSVFKVPYRNIKLFAQAQRVSDRAKIWIHVYLHLKPMLVSQLSDSKAQCSWYYLHSSPNHLASQIFILKPGGRIGIRTKTILVAIQSTNIYCNKIVKTQ